jgi:hypothetical protein
MRGWGASHDLASSTHSGWLLFKSQAELVMVWFGLVRFLGGNVVVGHILYEHTFTAILS